MSKNILPILNWLLTTKPDLHTGNFESVVHWKRHHEKELDAWAQSADRAMAGGVLAACPAYAFAGGYWAALQRLLPDLPKGPVPALCISEKQGVHPGKIKCRLAKSGDHWHLNGEKNFVTCGREAGLLLVAASTGTAPDGKNCLRLARVNKNQGGIKVKPLEKPLAILPEISHGAVSFSHVAVSEADLLPGDGYPTFIKPFRTIEDLHIMAALGGYLLRIGTLYNWPRTAREQLLTLLLTLRTLSLADYTAPEIHIAAAGAIAGMQTLLKSTASCWDLVAPDIRQAWHRDRVVLDIAADARRKRLATAWQQFA